MPRRPILPPLGLLLLLAPGVAGQAPPPEADAARPTATGEDGGVWRVGTKEVPPFVMRGPTGSWYGLSIDLWQALAQEMGIEYELVDRPLDALFTDLEDGTLDAAVAALTVTAQRELRVDFSHPYLTSGLAIATVEGGGQRWMEVARRFVSLDFLQVVLALLGVLLIVGLLIWLLERRRNAGEFGGGPVEGLGAGVWWSAVTMTTVGYGDKAPKTLGGRLLALLWMFAALIAISTFTAAITSALTVGELGTRVRGPGDLGTVRTGAVSETTGALYLAERGVRFEELPSVEAALSALERGELEAVVYDRPVLSHLLQDRGGRIRLLGAELEEQHYAIALPNGSQHRERLNQVLLRTLDTEPWRRTVRSYLGDEESE